MDVSFICISISMSEAFALITISGYIRDMKREIIHERRKLSDCLFDQKPFVSHRRLIPPFAKWRAEYLFVRGNEHPRLSIESALSNTRE